MCIVKIRVRRALNKRSGRFRYSEGSCYDVLRPDVRIKLKGKNSRGAAARLKYIPEPSRLLLLLSSIASKSDVSPPYVPSYLGYAERTIIPHPSPSRLHDPR